MGKEDMFLVTLQDTQGETIVFDYNHAVRIKEQRRLQLLEAEPPKNNRFLKFVNLFNNLMKGNAV